MANMSVAQKLYASYPAHAFLRRHRPPNDRQLDEFLQLCAKRGLAVDGSSSQVRLACRHFFSCKPRFLLP
jgi:exoribonuclease R